MATPSVRIPVELDLSRAEKALKRGIGDKVVRIKLDPKDFNQPLGRITGKLGEFDNALAASNARVIAFGASASAKYGIQKAILEAPKRIERICIDIKKHFNEQVAPNGFKGMIVTSSRYAAILYKEQMDKISGPESTVIISGDHNDTQEYHEFTDKNKHKKL